MNKIKTIKIKDENDNVSEESYIISADAENIDMKNGYNLQDVIGTINIKNNGNIEQQLNILNTNMNNINTDIKRKAYYFDTVADMKLSNLKNGDFAITLGYYAINDGGGAQYKITNVNINYCEILNNNLKAELIIDNYIIPEWFGAYGDGIHDDTQSFQNAFNTISNGGLLLLQLNKSYKITDSITIPANVSMQGLCTFNDVSGKANYVVDTNVLKGMSSLIMTNNAQFLLKGNNDIEKICIVYPEQNYKITTVDKSSTYPDGLTNFIEYNPTFTLIGDYIGLVFKDIIYLGGTQFLYCGPSVNPEKLYVDRIIGMCVGTAFKIINCKDMMYFHNIHMNANSLKCYIQKVNNGNDKNFYTKCAKNSVLFSFGDFDYGCDGTWINNCFTYGVKRFIELKGRGNSVQLNQCGADVCYEFLYIDSSVKPFGTYLNNCVVTPIVYKAIVNGVESTQSPCLIRIADGRSDQKIQVTNCTVFGNHVPLIDDSDTCNYILSCSDTSQNTRVNLVNCTFHANYLQEGFNVIGKNNISQNVANNYRILTAQNTLLNGFSVDTNINQCKIIQIQKNIDTTETGTQTVSGVGFKPNSIEIMGLIGSSQIASDGVSDGNLSVCISTDSTGIKFKSGGTAVIQQFCTNINNRYYAELQSINDDGFVLNWGYVGTPPSGTASMIVICKK